MKKLFILLFVGITFSFNLYDFFSMIYGSTFTDIFEQNNVQTTINETNQSLIYTIDNPIVFLKFNYNKEYLLTNSSYSIPIIIGIDRNVISNMNDFDKLDVKFIGCNILTKGLLKKVKYSNKCNNIDLTNSIYCIDMVNIETPKDIFGDSILNPLVLECKYKVKESIIIPIIFAKNPGYAEIAYKSTNIKIKTKYGIGDLEIKISRMFPIFKSKDLWFYINKYFCNENSCEFNLYLRLHRRTKVLFNKEIKMNFSSNDINNNIIESILINTEYESKKIENSKPITITLPLDYFYDFNNNKILEESKTPIIVIINGGENFKKMIYNNYVTFLKIDLEYEPIFYKVIKFNILKYGIKEEEEKLIKEKAENYNNLVKLLNIEEPSKDYNYKISLSFDLYIIDWYYTYSNDKKNTSITKILLIPKIYINNNEVDLKKLTKLLTSSYYLSPFLFYSENKDIIDIFVGSNLLPPVKIEEFLNKALPKFLAIITDIALKLSGNSKDYSKYINILRALTAYCGNTKINLGEALLLKSYASSFISLIFSKNILIGFGYISKTKEETQDVLYNLSQELINLAKKKNINIQNSKVYVVCIKKNVNNPMELKSISLNNLNDHNIESLTSDCLNKIVNIKSAQLVDIRNENKESIYNSLLNLYRLTNIDKNPSKYFNNYQDYLKFVNNLNQKFLEFSKNLSMEIYLFPAIQQLLLKFLTDFNGDEFILYKKELCKIFGIQ